MRHSRLRFKKLALRWEYASGFVSNSRNVRGKFSRSAAVVMHVISGCYGLCRMHILPPMRHGSYLHTVHATSLCGTAGFNDGCSDDLSRL